MKKQLYNIVILIVSSAFGIFNTLTAQTLTARDNNSIYICDNGVPNIWGSSAGSYTPIVFPGFNTGDVIIDASRGSGFNLFLKDNNTVWTCGNNDFGQTGHVNQTLVPLQIAGHNGVTKIGTGFYHAFFIKNDNTVWAFGRNDKGQLGDGNITGIGANPTPVQVNITDVVQVTGGFYHSIFLKSDGTVWHCGRTVNNVANPIQFAGLSNITAIAAGQYFSLFLKNDGTVWVCGNNQYGQFGNGTTSTSETDTPTQVPGLTGIVSIAAGDAFSLFVKGDGTVWSCGRNDNGQLGDGTLIDQTSPVQVSGITNVTNAAAGYKHSVFLKSDSTVWACGYNLLGQLGDGTNIDKSTPVQVTNLCEATSMVKELNSNMLNIYPNPSNGVFHVSCQNNQPIDIIIYNAIGEKVYENKDLDNNTSVNLSNQSRGLYIVTIINGEDIATQKLIIQ